MAGKGLSHLLRFVAAYFRANWAIALEYRVTLISQLVGMLVNDTLWVVFWVLYFSQFPVLKGWTLEDVLVLWATFGFSAGLVMGLFTNSIRIPQLVVQGQLDYYLALPKNVLLHLLVSRMAPINITDLLFGPLLLVLMVPLTWTKVSVFFATSLLSATVMLGFFILVGSLTFFVGHSETLAGQAMNALLHFASYPAPIFQGGVKMVLYTLIPAGFVTALPVELVRHFSPVPFLQLLGGAALFLGLAIWVFNQGLKRYESGNLLGMRS